MNAIQARKKIQEYINNNKQPIETNTKLAYKWWRVLNVAIFNNELTPPKKISCTNMRSKNLGECIPLGERVHQFQWLKYGTFSHGPARFYNWTPKFKRAGLTLDQYIDIDQLTE